VKKINKKKKMNEFLV